MARTILALVAGLVAAFIALGLVALIGGSAFPVSAEVSVRDPAAIKAVFAALPVQLKLVILLAWFVGALVGGLVAKWICGRNWTVWAIAIFFAVYVAMNIAVLPMPAWMQVAALIAPLLGGAIVQRYGPSPAIRDEPWEDRGDAYDRV